MTLHEPTACRPLSWLLTSQRVSENGPFSLRGRELFSTFPAAWHARQERGKVRQGAPCAFPVEATQLQLIFDASTEPIDGHAEKTFDLDAIPRLRQSPQSPQSNREPVFLRVRRAGTLLARPAPAFRNDDRLTAAASWGLKGDIKRHSLRKFNLFGEPPKIA